MWLLRGIFDTHQGYKKYLSVSLSFLVYQDLFDEDIDASYSLYSKRNNCNAHGIEYEKKTKNRRAPRMLLWVSGVIQFYFNISDHFGKLEKKMASDGPTN